MTGKRRNCTYSEIEMKRIPDTQEVVVSQDVKTSDGRQILSQQAADYIVEYYQD
jgi:hypothetical protein